LPSNRKDYIPSNFDLSSFYSDAFYELSIFRNQNEMISKGNENKLDNDVMIRRSTLDTDEEERNSASDCMFQFNQLLVSKPTRHTFEDLVESNEYCRICLDGET
jgi:hypothetical protein